MIVSIHAPRTGRDHKLSSSTSRKSLFQSTRPARGATACVVVHAGCLEFQSTRPARGATSYYHLLIYIPQSFNPRAPHGARLARGALHHAVFYVSIHAPRTGRDHINLYQRPALAVFQSTRPARGATRRRIHITPPNWFQSTRPARGATETLDLSSNLGRFQSTRPARGATRSTLSAADHFTVSIHAPRTGRDPCCPNERYA